MAGRPSIVIIPGSFCTASWYYELSDKIKQHGFEVFANNLPSASRHAPEKPASLDDDAVFFRGIIEKIASESKDVIVVAHSYGGVVGTEAVKGVSKADRQANGLSGGVIRLVYLSALVLAEGDTAQNDRGDPPPELMETSKDGFMRIIGIEPCAKATFPELPLNEAIDMAKHFVSHSAASFAGQLTYPAYKYIPVSYIFCENDFIVPPESQRKYIERIKTESGRDVDVRTLKTGHCPNITAPDKLAETIIDIAASA